MSTTTAPDRSRVQTISSSIETSAQRSSVEFHLVTSSTFSASATTTVTSIPTTYVATTSSRNIQGLNTSAAIGISVAIVVFVGLGAGLGYWIFRMRRRKQQHSWLTQLPVNNRDSGLKGRDTLSGSFSEDRERLVGQGPRNPIAEREELHYPSKPTEMASVELMDLGGDSRTWGTQTASVIQRLQRPSTSHSTSTQQGAPPTSPPSLFINSPEQCFLRPNYASGESAAAQDPRSLYSHMQFETIDEGAPSLYKRTDSPAKRPFLHAHESSFRHQSCIASMKHNSLESNAYFVTGEGPEAAYTLFRWPETAYQFSASSFR